jgi:hypothetical protein
LHPFDVDCHSVFSCQFNRHREMIDLLIRVKPLVEIVFALGMSPK